MTERLHEGDEVDHVFDLGSISQHSLWLLLQEEHSGFKLAAEERSAHRRSQTARAGVHVSVLNTSVLIPVLFRLRLPCRRLTACCLFALTAGCPS